MAALLARLAGRGGAGKREKHTTYLKQKRRTKGWITFELKVLLVCFLMMETVSAAAKDFVAEMVYQPFSST